ncbi:uncharacterized protein N7459_008323 [Penicillium hispanicum]|uniref:uncharacterized protein n=1 Tax=Penicillium hispanicum TaxID=1080232 RepID=UPI0025406FD7|nr:uncharacterized protein N7459_008323 [Penicillium hispanicum]KAJ5573896.1 hypothetical protein N7459_008323 [Penicillium hispanicum]
MIQSMNLPNRQTPPLPLRTPTHASTASDSASLPARSRANKLRIEISTFWTQVVLGASVAAAAAIAEVVAIVHESSVVPV